MSRDAVIHMPIRREGDRLVPEEEPAELGRRIAENAEIFILRGAYTSRQMLDLRRMLMDWSSSNKVWPEGVSASVPGISYHRIDDGSAPTSMPHIFHQWGFDDLPSLPDELGRVMRSMGDELLMLQNEIAGTSFGPRSGEFRFKALQHPRGGGHLVPHTHPYKPAKVAIFVNASEPGTDYDGGAARFRTEADGWIDTFDEFRIGDLLAWRYDLLHDVAPVDPGRAVDWGKDDGLWILAMEWTEAHPLSHAK